MEMGTFKSSNLKSTLTFTDIGLLFLYVMSPFNKNVSIKITMNSTHRVWLNKSISDLKEGGGALLTCQFNIDFFFLILFCLQAIIDSTGNNLTLIFLLVFFIQPYLLHVHVH